MRAKYSITDNNIIDNAKNAVELEKTLVDEGEFFQEHEQLALVGCPESEPNGEKGRKKRGPGANGAKKNNLIKVCIKVFRIPQASIPVFSSLLAMYLKRGDIFLKNRTIAEYTGLSERSVSHHLGVLRALTAPGIENCPLVIRIPRTVDRRHAWRTLLPFAATLLEYCYRQNKPLEKCSQEYLLDAVSTLWPAYHFEGKAATFSASRLSELSNKKQKDKTEKTSPYIKELSLDHKKIQQTTLKFENPVVVPSEPEIKNPEPPPEQKPYFALFADTRLAELAATLKLNVTNLVKKAASCAVQVKDFKALIEYVYDRWLKGLVKNSPMAYLLGTLPNYVSPPTVYDYQVKAAEKATDERRHDWEKGKEKKTRSAMVEQRLCDDPAFSRCRALADQNFAPLSLLVEIWQEHNATNELPPAPAFEALLETALLESPSPLVFANVFETVAKRHCTVKN